MENQAPRKFRLRRLQPMSPRDKNSDESLIKKNLQPLIQNVEKKKRAQEIYYENHAELIGASPLTRDLDKKPVKQRLGRRIPFTGTNTSAIPPKRRLRRLKSTFNNQITKRKLKNFSAQHRLNLIRARNQQTEAASQTAPKKFRLRRLLPGNLMTNSPRNFRVQVRNTNAFADKQNFVQGVRRFKQVLDPPIQLEIKRIQLEFQRGPILVPTAVRPVTTALTMHERFALLS